MAIRPRRWQQPISQKSRCGGGGGEKRWLSLLLSCQTPAPAPRPCPPLTTPIDFLVYEASPSLCVYSLSGLASLRAPWTQLVPILLAGLSHHIHTFTYIPGSSPKEPPLSSLLPLTWSLCVLRRWQDKSLATPHISPLCLPGEKQDTFDSDGEG